MIRKFKFLSLALVAVMALTAVAASAASAASHFESTKATTFLSGDQKTENVFTVSGFPVKCTTAHFTGTQSGTEATEVTVHPEYSGCTFLSEGATVTTTGCNYTLGAATTSAMGNVVVGCEGSSQIKVTTSACTLFIGSQTLTSAVGYSNEGSPGAVLVTATTGNKVAIAKKEGSLCGLFGSTGSYTGPVLTKGYEDVGHTAQVAVKYVE